MTRDHHLEFCNVCQHKKFDPKQGIVCGLTMEIANFDEECTDYLGDERLLEQRKRERLNKEADETYRATGGLSMIGITNGYLAGGIIILLAIIWMVLINSWTGGISIWGIIGIFGGFVAIYWQADKENKARAEGKKFFDDELLDDHDGQNPEE